LGDAHYALGQVEQVIKYHKLDLNIAREAGNRHGEAISLHKLGNAYCRLGRIQQAIEFHENALGIIRGMGSKRGMGDKRGESYYLLGLGKTLLIQGELSRARQCCTEALTLDVPGISNLAALTLGFILLCQNDPVSGATFEEGAVRCRKLFAKAPDSYELQYALATTLTGQAVCDPGWAEKNKRAGLLAPALVEYQRALEICAAPGVVQDALRDLELIRAAGVAGLEPVFELLETALEKP
jgi:tetratricopeptide (TPR) repeat protein